MSFAHRKTVHLENEKVRVTVLPGGGHIAELKLLSNGVNPLWDPPWETIEPTQYDPSKHDEYGPTMEGGLLAGITGHNLCFDFFGPPSDEEAAAGLYVHGEASFVEYDVTTGDGEMVCKAEFPLAGFRFERRLKSSPRSHVVVITETAENLSSADRAVGWTQHATLGPPFLVKGETEFHMPATSSRVFEEEFAPGHERLERGADFTWPMVPKTGGGFSDLRILPDDEVSGAFTAHLMNPAHEHAYFTAFSKTHKTATGYIWKRSDFPWLGIWEENFSRAHPPWRSRTLTRGMEFSASPFPETRRAMIDRGETFGEKGYRWIPAKATVSVEYCMFITESERAPETVEWVDGEVRSEGLFSLKV